MTRDKDRILELRKAIQTICSLERELTKEYVRGLECPYSPSEKFFFSERVLDWVRVDLSPDVDALVRKGTIAKAIIHFRNETGCSLVEAREVIDHYRFNIL